MSIQALHHLRVLVVSPGNVAKEQEQIPNVLKRINRTLAHNWGLHLDGYVWETDVYTAFPVEGSRKGLVNAALKAEDADIVVGIFRWLRNGDCIGFDSERKTGAQRELDSALKAWKASSGSRPQHIAVYRNKQVSPPEASEGVGASRQLSALTRYLRSLTELGVIGGYDDANEFGLKLYEDLANYLRRKYTSRGFIMSTMRQFDATTEESDASQKDPVFPTSTTSDSAGVSATKTLPADELQLENAASSSQQSYGQHYEPYPPESVDKLEQLTRQRDDGTPEERSDRQHQIDELVAELKRSPRRGDVVAGAKLGSIIGKGNYGTVWSATDVKTGDIRAVKVFDSDRLGLGTSLQHFRRGVRAMQHLNAIDGRPKTIVRLCSMERSQLAFGMALLDGGDLTNIAQRGWSLAKKLECFQTVCMAVQFAHENGVIHRDIKPANIVVHQGEPVLTDFDIADLLFAQTKSAHAAGTVLFSAPEELANNGTKSCTADVYSLGRLLYFLLLEANPPLGFQDLDRLDGIVTEYPGLARVIRKCTRGEPGVRYSCPIARGLDHPFATKLTAPDRGKFTTRFHGKLTRDLQRT